MHIFKFMNLILGLDDEEESSIPEKKKRKTRDISPIEWDRKSEGILKNVSFKIMWYIVKYTVLNERKCPQRKTNG